MKGREATQLFRVRNILPLQPSCGEPRNIHRTVR